MKSLFNTSYLQKKCKTELNQSNKVQHDSSEQLANFNQIQPNLAKPQPFNPNCSKYQYNVEIEGVIFDVLAPCDLLNELPLENIEMEE